MPFSSGSVTCVPYRVTDDLPENFAETAQRALTRYAFRDIDAERGETRAFGWANPFDLLSKDFKIENLLVDAYLSLGMRVDRKSPPKALVSARIQTMMDDRLKASNRKRLSADEVRTIREEALRRQLAETSPTTAVHEVLWNIEEGWLYFSSTSVTANTDFLDLFADTFGLDIMPVLPYTYAETWADSKGLVDELESMEAARFGGRSRPAAPTALPPWETEEA